MPSLVAATDITRVDLDLNMASGVGDPAKVRRELVAEVEHRLRGFRLVGDGNDHNMRRREPRRKNHAVVIGVGHDHAADEPR